MMAFVKRTRLWAIALAVALAVQPLASMTPVGEARANPYYSSSVGSSGTAGLHQGGWIVPVMFLGVGSIIGCAIIVGSQEGRELTLEEAVHAGIFPLHCLIDDHF